MIIRTCPLSPVFFVKSVLFTPVFSCIIKQVSSIIVACNCVNVTEESFNNFCVYMIKRPIFIVSIGSKCFKKKVFTLLTALPNNISVSYRSWVFKVFEINLFLLSFCSSPFLNIFIYEKANRINLSITRL